MGGPGGRECLPPPAWGSGCDTGPRSAHSSSAGSSHQAAPETRRACSAQGQGARMLPTSSGAPSAERGRRRVTLCPRTRRAGSQAETEMMEERDAAAEKARATEARPAGGIHLTDQGPEASQRAGARAVGGRQARDHRTATRGPLTCGKGSEAPGYCTFNSPAPHGLPQTRARPGCGRGRGWPPAPGLNVHL